MKTVYGVPSFFGRNDLAACWRQRMGRANCVTMDTMARHVAADLSNSSRACVVLMADDAVRVYQRRYGAATPKNVTIKTHKPGSDEARLFWKSYQEA